MNTRIEEAVTAHLTSLTNSGASASTINARRRLLGRFLDWTSRSRLAFLSELTPQYVAAYQLRLSDTGTSQKLSVSAQRNRLVAVRMFARWAQRTGLLTQDPTALLDLPRVVRRLPRSVLTSVEAERILAVPDVDTRLGLRDRAILELLYSSGLRRMELVQLDLADLDLQRGVLLIRLGKGRKDRYVPVGRRALEWIKRYLRTSRQDLVGPSATQALFVGSRGARLSRSRLNERLRQYIVRSRIGKPGSCHIWRHTMATLMHERGADLRDLQVMLGHAQISTTAIYTHISTERLQEVHWRTHPASRYRRSPRPGLAVVNSPRSTSATPFTNTHGIPTA